MKHALETEPGVVRVLVSIDVPDRWTSDEQIRETAAKSEPQEHEAWFLGPFAVHEDYSGRWTLTHAPTGFSVRSDFPTRRMALGAAAELLISVPASWDFDDPATTRSWSPEAKESVRKAVAKRARS